jgi:predicted GNAT family acetyltransferase
VNATTPVRDVPERSRYELETPAGVAVAEYERADGVQTMTHTIVPEGARGGGVASRLVRYALDDARSRGLKVVPQCRYVARFVEAHPEYAHLVARD